MELKHDQFFIRLERIHLLIAQLTTVFELRRQRRSPPWTLAVAPLLPHHRFLEVGGLFNLSSFMVLPEASLNIDQRSGHSTKLTLTLKKHLRSARKPLIQHSQAVEGRLRIKHASHPDFR